MIQKNLSGLGMHPLLAQRTAGNVSNSLTATGSGQSDAYQLTEDISVFTTTASSTGAKLRADLNAGDTMEVVNYGAQTLTVYPPTGGKINNGSANAGVSVAANTSAIYTSIDGTNFFGVKSA